jgi:hypothetical protein
MTGATPNALKELFQTVGADLLGGGRFEPTDISDSILLRHFGITEIDGRPVFDGFYSTTA